MSLQIRQIPRTKTILDGTEWIEGQDALGGPSSSFKAPSSALSQIGVIRIDYDANATITAENLDSLHTNIIATTAITLALPPALVGSGGRFYSTGLYDLILLPNGSDVIGDGGVGKKLYIRTQGLVIIDGIDTAGYWQVTSDTPIILWEL
jgi:hypothetical protein